MAIFAGIYPVLAGPAIPPAAKINQPDAEGNLPLGEALKSGPLHTIRGMLTAGADANLRDAEGFSAANRAIKYQRPKAFALMLGYGADTNAKTEAGDCPLHYAVGFRQTEIIDLLLESGADVNCSDADGRTILMHSAHHALEIRSQQDPIFAKIMARHPDLNARDKTGKSAMFYAIEFGHFQALSALAEAGADVNLADAKGNTVLMKIATTFYSGSMKDLVSYGADVNHQNRDGDTAAHLCMRSCQPYGLFPFLYELPKVNWNLRNAQGDTPLHIGMRRKFKGNGERSFLDYLELMIKAGANPRLRNGQGESAIAIAQKEKWPERLAILSR